MKDLVAVLRERGFIDAVTSDELEGQKPQDLKIYVGFDPTSDSLHLGNLVAVMGLAWCQRFGCETYAIAGGATGMIGDPSGKSHERNLLDEATIQKNLEGITRSLGLVLDSDQTRVLNNFDWFSDVSFIHFLREVGKQFRMGTMLAKESVKTRLSSEEGMSFTEFSYQLLQAYDFLHLYDHFGVNVQMGGSDQWGNITAGIELIRKMRGGQAYGMTFPLLTRSDGKKFGKSAEGAIWLNPEKITTYDFYQHLVRLQDDEVIPLMRLLTFMEMDEIEQIERAMKNHELPPNDAQTRLASEVTKMLHGEEALLLAQQVTKAAKPGGKTSLDGATLQALCKELPSRSLQKHEVEDLTMLDLLDKTGLLSSRSEARRLIKGGGAYLNNEKIQDERAIVDLSSLIDGQWLLVSVGKKKKIVLRVEK